MKYNYSYPTYTIMEEKEGLVFRDEVIGFKLPKQKPCIIKVIGVGGGGGNAVTHMFNQGIHDVSFAVCNLDAQALNDSPVPYRLQLGQEGLGAGNKPEKAAEAAENSLEEIHKMLDDGTRMVFITAGMGGGTGTGAAPIIAREAKRMGILTIGIVTIPFIWEGKRKINKALDGVENLSKNVDALLVINNQRLLELYPELTVSNAFAKADDTLSIAAKSISDIITFHGQINLDFNDVSTVMKDGGVAIMSMAYGEGEHRVTDAINNALNSPLLNNGDIFKSKKFLLNIAHSAEEENSQTLRMEEMQEVHDFMSRFSDDIEVKWGMVTDASLGAKVKITILATGFGVDDVMRPDLTGEEIAKRQKEETRYKDYYGDDGKPHPKEYITYTFNADTLDNDDIISMLDKPTYKRKVDFLKSINTRETQVSRSISSGTGDAEIPQTISFSQDD